MDILGQQKPKLWLYITVIVLLVLVAVTVFYLLNDSIYSTTKSQQIEELKTIYETEKKEVAIALQEEEIIIM